MRNRSATLRLLKDTRGLWSLPKKNQQQQQKKLVTIAWYFYILEINTNTIKSWCEVSGRKLPNLRFSSSLEVSWMPPKTRHLLHLHFTYTRSCWGRKRGRIVHLNYLKINSIINLRCHLELFFPLYFRFTTPVDPSS